MTMTRNYKPGRNQVQTSPVRSCSARGKMVRTRNNRLGRDQVTARGFPARSVFARENPRSDPNGALTQPSIRSLRNYKLGRDQAKGFPARSFLARENSTSMPARITTMFLMILLCCTADATCSDDCQDSSQEWCYLVIDVTKDIYCNTVWSRVPKSVLTPSLEELFKKAAKIEFAECYGFPEVPDPEETQIQFDTKPSDRCTDETIELMWCNGTFKAASEPLKYVPRPEIYLAKSPKYQWKVNLRRNKIPNIRGMKPFGLDIPKGVDGILKDLVFLPSTIASTDLSLYKQVIACKDSDAYQADKMSALGNLARVLAEQFVLVLKLTDNTAKPGKRVRKEIQLKPQNIYEHLRSWNAVWLLNEDDWKKKRGKHIIVWENKLRGITLNTVVDSYGKWLHMYVKEPHIRDGEFYTQDSRGELMYVQDSSVTSNTYSPKFMANTGECMFCNKSIAENREDKIHCQNCGGIFCADCLKEFDAPTEMKNPLLMFNDSDDTEDVSYCVMCTGGKTLREFLKGLHYDNVCMEKLAAPSSLEKLQIKHKQAVEDNLKEARARVNPDHSYWKDSHYEPRERKKIALWDVEFYEYLLHCADHPELTEANKALEKKLYSKRPAGRGGPRHT